jgi:arylformamidase
MGMGMPSWIDISVPLYTGMVHWPDNPPVRIERMKNIEEGDVANVSAMSMGVHTGTHVDAPIHFLRDGRGVHLAPFEALIGPARVIEIKDTHAVKMNELEHHDIQPGERLLFKTLNSTRCWQTDDFIEDFVYISQAAARYLSDRNVRTVGVDYLSVGGFTTDAEETHQAGIAVRRHLDHRGARPLGGRARHIRARLPTPQDRG